MTLGNRADDASKNFSGNLDNNFEDDDINDANLQIATSNAYRSLEQMMLAASTS